jgi:hypothetical protein
VAVWAGATAAAAAAAAEAAVAVARFFLRGLRPQSSEALHNLLAARAACRLNSRLDNLVKLYVQGLLVHTQVSFGLAAFKINTRDQKEHTSHVWHSLPRGERAGNVRLLVQSTDQPGRTSRQAAASA